MPPDLSLQELRAVAYDQLGIRVSAEASAEEIHDLLDYKKSEDALPANITNALRDEMISFIKANEGRLSLPCSGNCYEHSDGVVLSCYRELMRDRHG